MKFIVKSIVFILFYIFSLLVFFPKEQFYYLIEKQLTKKNLIISDEKIDEKLFALNFKDAQLYYDGINFSFVNDVKVSSFLFYNKVEVKGVSVSKSFSDFLPSNIDFIKIKYSVIDVMNIDIFCNGDFGFFNGKISIFDRKISGELVPSSIMQTKYNNLLKRFKRVEGKYLYEFKF